MVLYFGVIEERSCTQMTDLKGELSIIVPCCPSDYLSIPFGCRSTETALRCAEDLELCDF